MKFIFTAPRMHTNQNNIIESLISEGHSVEFYAQYVGHTESHDLLKPQLLRKSALCRLLHLIFEKRYSGNDLENMKRRYFIPSMPFILSDICSNEQQVIILRNRSIESVFIFNICRFYKNTHCILYNQMPLHVKAKNSLKERIARITLPMVRITPVLYDASSLREDPIPTGKQTDRAYFLPFIEKEDHIKKMEYLNKGEVNILDVGKYRDYKNHFFLVDVIESLENKKDLNVTIIGQVGNEQEEDYYTSLKKYIHDKGLDDCINLKKNIKYEEMEQEYLRNDIFILASKKEAASVSIIESMSYGLVTISSDRNGTASYIDHGKNGYLFESQSLESLRDILTELLVDRDKIARIGSEGVKKVESDYSSVAYMSLLKELLSKEFKIDL